MRWLQMIKINLTLIESDFLTELLEHCEYGKGSSVRQQFEAKLEAARLMALGIILQDGEI